MMLKYFNPFPVLRDQFRPFSHRDGRKWKPSALVPYLLLPVAIGASVTWISGPLSEASAIGVFIAVFSVLATVLTAIMVLIYTLIASTNLSELLVRSPQLHGGENKDIARVETLRELFTNTAFAVIVLVLSIPALLVLLASGLPRWLALFLTGWAFGAGVVSLMCVLTIMIGLYHIIDRDGESMQSAVRQKTEPTPHATTPSNYLDDSAASQTRQAENRIAPA